MLAVLNFTDEEISAINEYAEFHEMTVESYIKEAVMNQVEFESDQDGFEEKVSEIIAQAAMLEDA